MTGKKVLTLGGAELPMTRFCGGPKKNVHAAKGGADGLKVAKVHVGGPTAPQFRRHSVRAVTPVCTIPVATSTHMLFFQ